MQKFFVLVETLSRAETKGRNLLPGLWSFLISILIGKGRVTLKVRITNGKD